MVQLLDDNDDIAHHTLSKKRAKVVKPGRFCSEVPSETISPKNFVPGSEPFVMADFTGLEQVCRNAGATTAGFELFLSQIYESKDIVVSFLWSSLCSNYSSTSVRFCTPSIPCVNWNCSCDRHVRFIRVGSDLLGAIFHLPSDSDNSSTAYLLPLCECEGPPESVLSSPTRLPFFCEVPLSARWDGLLAILRSNQTRKILYNTQLCLLTVFRHCQQSCLSPIAATELCQQIVDPKICMHLCDTDASESSLELETLLMQNNIRVVQDMCAMAQMRKVARAVSRCVSLMRAVIVIIRK